MAELYEYYNTGDNADWLLYTPRQLAQTYTPLLTFTLQYIKLKLRRVGNPTNLVVQIQSTTEDGKPSGEVLSESIVAAADVPTEATWLAIYLPEVLQTVEVQYAIVILTPGGNSSNCYRLRYDNTYATYPRGKFGYSANGGTTWTMYANYDGMFETWGIPPPPPIPETTTNKWQVLTYSPEITCTGYILHLTTDVVCHLYGRLSENPPQIHTRSVIVRGLAVRDDLRFCFTVYHDIEQDEEGDTLTHTFTLEPWPDCTTKYFYFFATIEEAYSSSTSPTFSIARPNVYCAKALHLDFRCTNPYKPTLLEAILANGDWASDDEFNVGFFSVYHVRWGWHVYRGCLVFDMTWLDVNIQVIDYTIHFWVAGKHGAHPGNLMFLEVPYVELPAEPSDYQKLYQATNILALMKADDVKDGQWNSLTLTKTRFRYGRPSGLMVLGCRSYSDYTKTQCPDWETKACGYEIAAFDSLPPDTHQPYCLVRYKCT